MEALAKLRRCGGLYEIVNIVNGRRYVGSARRFLNRFAEHRYALRRGRHCNPKLQAAWNKYGEATFAFRPLVVLPTDDAVALLAYEQRLLDTVFRDERPYNVNRNASSGAGRRARLETRELIRRAMMGRVFTDEHRQRISAARMGLSFGPLSPEHRRKIGEGNRGRRHTPETLRKMSEAQRGRTHSPETRARLSYLASQRPPEALERMAAAQRGKTRSMESRARQSEAQRGRKRAPFSEDHCRKLSEGRSKVLYSGFVSPSGERFDGIRNLQAFCTARGLDRAAMLRVFTGRVRQHRGWTVSDPQKCAA